jgi:hypothetical protein
MAGMVAGKAGTERVSISSDATNLNVTKDTRTRGGRTRVSTWIEN